RGETTTSRAGRSSRSPIWFRHGRNDRVKLLFLGGTGNISSACVDLAVERGHDVTILNRGRTPSRLRAPVQVVAGERDDGALLRRLADGARFDGVVDFLAYRPD